MKSITLFFAALSVAVLTGCGHNAIIFDKGVGFRAGFDPEHLSADVRFVYGEAVTLAVRDKIELELVSDAEGGQEQPDRNSRLKSAARSMARRAISSRPEPLPNRSTHCSIPQNRLPVCHFLSSHAASWSDAREVIPAGLLPLRLIRPRSSPAFSHLSAGVFLLSAIQICHTSDAIR